MMVGGNPTRRLTLKPGELAVCRLPFAVCLLPSEATACTCGEVSLQAPGRER